MKEACPLKAREYLDLGLPVYGNYKESLPPTFPYYQQGEPELRAILRFANKMAVVNHHQIREESIPFIDKTLLLQQLYHAILNIASN